MKVLHVADYLPELHHVAGGAEFATRRVIAEQIAAGVALEVVTLPREKSATLPWSSRYELANLDRYAPRLAFAVKQLYYPADPLAQSAFKRVLKQCRPDIVHFHNLHYSGLSVLDTAHAAGLPTVMTIYDYWLFCPSFMLLTSSNELCRRGHGEHCVDCMGTRRLRILKPIKKALFGARPKVFGQLAAKIERFVVLSSASRDILIEQGISPERVEVIPQYLWQEAANTVRAEQPQRGRLIYVGWVEARKGLHVVLEAFAQIATDYPELTLEVFGMPANSEYAKDIESIVTRNNLAPRVHFQGKVGREELLRELHRAFLVLVPEQWENMSPVILTEAMAAGACVLASRIGGIREFVDEFGSGLLAERDQPTEFADRMRWAMAHEKEVVAMGEMARARARQLFNPTTVTDKTLALYRELIATGATKLGKAKLRKVI